MKVETGQVLTSNMARLIHVLGFVLACALPTWVFFQIDGESVANHLARLALLGVVGWLAKGLLYGLKRVDAVEERQR